MSKKNRILLSIICSFIFVSSSFSLTKEVKQPAAQEEIKLHRHKLKCWQKFINFLYKFCFKDAYFPEGLFGKLILDNKGKEYSGEELLHFNIFPFLGIKNLGALRGSCKYMQEVVVDYWKNYLKNAPKKTVKEKTKINRLFLFAVESGYFKVIKFFATDKSLQNIIYPHYFFQALNIAVKNNVKKNQKNKKIIEYLVSNKKLIENPEDLYKGMGIGHRGISGVFDSAICSNDIETVKFLAKNKITRKKISPQTINGMLYSAAFQEEGILMLELLIKNKTTQKLISSGSIDKKSGVDGAFYGAIEGYLLYGSDFASKKEFLQKLTLLLNNKFTQKLITPSALERAITLSQSEGMKKITTILKKFKKENVIEKRG